MEIPPLFNRRLIKATQEALDYEKGRSRELLALLQAEKAHSQELIELLQKVEVRNSAALQYRSAAFPTVTEDGWVETFDDFGQKVFIKPN